MELSERQKRQLKDIIIPRLMVSWGRGMQGTQHDAEKSFDYIMEDILEEVD